jgi:hypothetical protein
VRTSRGLTGHICEQTLSYRAQGRTKKTRTKQLSRKNQLQEFLFRFFIFFFGATSITGKHKGHRGALFSMRSSSAAERRNFGHFFSSPEPIFQTRYFFLRFVCHSAELVSGRVTRLGEFLHKD